MDDPDDIPVGAVAAKEVNKEEEEEGRSEVPYLIPLRAMRCIIV